MVVDKLDDLRPFLLVQGSPLDRLSLHFLLRSRMGAAVAGEEFESELYGVEEYALEVWLFGDLEDECGVGC